jgi:hypothetical protein
MSKKMIKGVTKMEKDRMAGRAYASGIRMAGSEEDNEDERPAKKRAKTANNPQDNNNNKNTFG